MTAVATVLHVLGYPTAIAVLTRWIPVVREQRDRWFAAHQAGVAAIVAGWAIRGRTQGVIINGAWFVIAAFWYLSRRRRP